jgi:hypothetical protein
VTLLVQPGQRPLRLPSAADHDLSAERGPAHQKPQR